MDGASSHDGKLHGNRQTVEAYDADHGRRSKHLSQPGRPSARGGHSGGVHEANQHDEIKHVVGEHGAAHTHEIHAKDGGGYASTTHHEDGYVHEHPHHDTLEEAHAHGANAMDDTDHLEANQDTNRRVEQRHSIEHRRSGSTGALNFMEPED